MIRSGGRLRGTRLSPAQTVLLRAGILTLAAEKEIETRMDAIAINPMTCTKCGVCAEVCPNQILRKNGREPLTVRPDRAGLCFQCGQCMAVCPTRSIRVEGLSYESDFVDLPKERLSFDPFLNFITSRRSVRNFTDQPVARETLEAVVRAISFAPPSFPPLKYSLTVVQDRATIQQALPHMVALYDFLLNALRNPVARWFIRKEVGGKRFRTMQTHLLPLLTQRLPALKNGSEDTLTRRAPAMILFLADRNGEDVRADVYIAATYGILAAHALGLGATLVDIIPPAVEKKKELRRMFRVGDDQEEAAAIILGHPKYAYRRGILRRIPRVQWL